MEPFWAWHIQMKPKRGSENKTTNKANETYFHTKKLPQVIIRIIFLIYCLPIHVVSSSVIMSIPPSLFPISTQIAPGLNIFTESLIGWYSTHSWVGNELHSSKQPTYLWKGMEKTVLSSKCCHRTTNHVAWNPMILQNTVSETLRGYDTIFVF
jgi:hypothetical protein